MTEKVLEAIQKRFNDAREEGKVFRYYRENQDADELLEFLRSQGWRQLAEDQSVPPIIYLAIKEAQWDYLKEGWRKVMNP